MLRRTQDEWSEKANDQGFSNISETHKSQPVVCDFLIRKGGAMDGNFILRVARHSLEVNGGYCGGNNRRARSILLPCLDLWDHKIYVHSPRTINIRIA